MPVLLDLVKGMIVVDITDQLSQRDHEKRDESGDKPLERQMLHISDDDGKKEKSGDKRHDGD